MTPRAAIAVVRRRPALLVPAAAAVLAAAAFALVGRASAPDLPLAPVVRGEFVEHLELRGEVRPERSIVLSAPSQAGDLQIVRLPANGARVRAGDVVVEFDGTQLAREIQEKRSELRQAEAEIEQVRSQAHITREQSATELLRARYDVERAELDLGKAEFLSRVELEQARLALEDARQRLRQAERKIQSDSAAAAADEGSRRQKREKALFELQRAERGLEALRLRAPADGMVTLMPNFRSAATWGAEQEFREGDRAWPGAGIVELPDLSSVHLAIRLEESDRGRLRPGQAATVRVDAVPGREFPARIADISVLTRLDFGAGWPPSRNFTLDLLLEESDDRLRPGMSGSARIAVDREPDVLMVPTAAVFQSGAGSVVYVRRGARFEEVPVQVARRGPDQVVIGAGVAEGDRVALRRPEAAR